MDTDNQRPFKEEIETPVKNKNQKRKRVKSETESIKDLSETPSDETVFQELFSDLPVEDHGKYQKYNKDNKWKLDKIPHHLLPSFNLTSFTDINDVRNLPLMEVSLPQSVYVASTQTNNVDMCHRRTIAVNAHITHLKSIRTAYIKTKKKSKQVRKEEKKGIYNSTLIDFAKLRDAHPDKYFDRDYDFYYTSGNLCVNPETEQILHTNGKHMNRLTLSVFNVNQSIPSIHPIDSVDFISPSMEECEIFEVEFSIADPNSFFVRRKHSISLHQYSDSKFDTIKKFQSKEVPLISFAQDKANANHLVITNLEHCLRIYDIEKSMSIQTIKRMYGEENKPSLKWNMIRSWDTHSYIYAASRKLYIIDRRTPEKEWRTNYCGYNENSHCSLFSSLAPSKFKHLFYIGSNHKAYCVDDRFFSKDIENKHTAVARWTHQMSSCPLMMATSCHNDCEYIALQSPLSADMRICENIQFLDESDDTDTKSVKKSRIEWTPEHVYKSSCLPFMPQSLESVFQEARKLGKCIKPDTGIVHRIKACNTGLAFVGDSANPYILTATSVGDVFARRMSEPDDDNKLNTPANVMSHFEENIFRSVKKPQLQVTKVCDLSGISKVFRCPTLSDLKPLEENLPVPQKRKYMGRWQKSIRSLHKYKDALVAELLSAWDVEEELDEEKDFNIKVLAQSTLGDSTSLVNGWLQTAPDIVHSTMLTMTSIPMDVYNSSSALLDTQTESELKINNETSADLEQTIVSSSKAKTSKKKSRYVKGF